MDHVGIVVGDLAAATAFFVALGLEADGSGSVQGDWVDRVVGLEGVRSEIVMLRPPGGGAAIELSCFRSPQSPPSAAVAANVPGIRHVALEVDDVDAALEAVRDQGFDLEGSLEQYEDVYRLCYVRGPDGILVELAQRVS